MPTGKVFRLRVELRHNGGKRGNVESGMKRRSTGSLAGDAELGGESVEFSIETSIAKKRSLRALRFGERSFTASEISKSTSRNDDSRKGVSKQTG